MTCSTRVVDGTVLTAACLGTQDQECEARWDNGVGGESFNQWAAQHCGVTGHHRFRRTFHGDVEIAIRPL